MLLALLLATLASAREGCLTHAVRLAGPPVARAGGEDDRPTSVDSVDSTLYPIRVHWSEEADETVAIEQVLPAAELAWQVQVEQMGWPPAAPDGELGGGVDLLDYYVTNEGTAGGAYTWGPMSDVVEGDDWFSVAAFMAVDPDIGADDMPTFVAHEFNHVLQYTIDGWESTFFVWESTAEAMEEFTVPESDLYFIDIRDFNILPFASILFDGYSDEIEEYEPYSYYEYGGSIVGMYIEHAHGEWDGTTLRDLWLAMAQGDRLDEPDYLDALTEIGGGSLQDTYLGLAEYRMFVYDDDDGAHYPEGGEWSAFSRLATEGELALSTVDGTSVTPVDEPYDLGSSYWKIAVDDQDRGELSFTLDGDDAVQWGLVVSAWPASGAASVTRSWAAEGEPVAVTVGLDGATKLMVGVANLGATDLDAQGRHERRSFSLALSRTVPEVSTGDSGEPSEKPEPEEDAGGCGCSAPVTPGALGLLVAVAALARRRS